MLKTFLSRLDERGVRSCECPRYIVHKIKLRSHILDNSIFINSFIFRRMYFDRKILYIMLKNGQMAVSSYGSTEEKSGSIEGTRAPANPA